jgi:hypothetical protein
MLIFNPRGPTDGHAARTGHAETAPGEFKFELEFIDVTPQLFSPT